MALVNNAPNNVRLLNDGNFVVKTALADPGVASTAFDLVQVTPYPATEQVVLNIYSSTLSGSNTTAAFTVQDSADNVTFTDTSTLGSVTKTVATPGVVGASVASFELPPGVKRYVRVSASYSGATTGGFTSSLAF